VPSHFTAIRGKDVKWVGNLGINPPGTVKMLECPESLIRLTKDCHPERSLARPLRQMESKDLRLHFRIL